MDQLDVERELIKNRMKQIKDDMHDVKRPNRHIVIAAGEPVLQEDQDEYRALHRMTEILETGLKQFSDGEYLRLREETKLEEIAPELKERFQGSYVSEEPPAEEKNEALAILNGQDEKPIKNDDISQSNDLAISNTKDYIAKLVGNPAIANKTESLQSTSIAIQEDIPAMEGEIIEDTHRISDGKFAHIKENAIDVPFEPVDEQSISNFPFIGETPHNAQASFAPNMSTTSRIEDITASTTNVDLAASNSNRLISDEDDHNMTPKENSQNDDLVEVVKTSRWKWLGDHKKQIVIALGVTALTISVVVAMTQIGPAIMAASQASKVAGLAGEMIKNRALWHTVSATEKIALHSSNTFLANMISGLTGSTASFANTGAWTIGGQALTDFAASAATAAQAAAAKVSMLKIGTSAGIIGGAMGINTGVFLPTKKSTEYKAIKQNIDNLTQAANSMSKDDQNATAQMISSRIISSDKLSDSERNILFKKLQKALKNIKKQNRKLEEKSTNDFESLGITEDELNMMFDAEPNPVKAM